jgi:flagellar protein FliO/FliZ
MADYLIRLAVLLPIVCALIVAVLFVAKRLQRRVPASGAGLAVSDVLVLGQGLRLGIVSIDDDRFLIAFGKGDVRSLGRLLPKRAEQP